MKEQLTLNDLCCYLPYGVDVITGLYESGKPQGFVKLDVKTIDTVISFSKRNVENKAMTPIFRNLATDLTREIEHNGERFVPLEKLQEIFTKRLRFDLNGFYYHINESLVRGKKQDTHFPFSQIEAYSYLYKWHFWLGDQSYFEKGIILDFNDVNGL